MNNDILIRDMEYLKRKQKELKLTDSQMLEWVKGKRDFDNEAYFLFLDNLRDSGLVNMWGSAGNLKDAFDSLTKLEAIAIFSIWAHDSERHEKQ